MKIVVSLLVVFFSYNLAYACSCIVPTDESKAQALKSASVIFSGKVISAEASSKNYETVVKFQVLRAWKGVETQEIIITTPSDSAACGYSFEKDTAYTVYGNGTPLSTNSCTMLQVDETQIRKAYGEGKVVEEQAPSKSEETKSYWTRFWRKLSSLFS